MPRTSKRVIFFLFIQCCFCPFLQGEEGMLYFPKKLLPVGIDLFPYLEIGWVASGDQKDIAGDVENVSVLAWGISTCVYFLDRLGGEIAFRKKEINAVVKTGEVVYNHETNQFEDETASIGIFNGTEWRFGGSWTPFVFSNEYFNGAGTLGVGLTYIFLELSSEGFGSETANLAGTGSGFGYYIKPSFRFVKNIFLGDVGLTFSSNYPKFEGASEAMDGTEIGVFLSVGLHL